MTNVILALIFLLLLLVLGNDGFANIVFGYGLRINALFAAFNMIPVMPFDGAKVIAWDKRVYGITVAIAVGLFIVSFFV